MLPYVGWIKEPVKMQKTFIMSLYEQQCGIRLRNFHCVHKTPDAVRSCEECHRWADNFLFDESSSLNPREDQTRYVA